MTKICLRLKAWLADHQLCSCSEVADLTMSLCKLKLATGLDNSRISVLVIWKLFLSHWGGSMWVSGELCTAQLFRDPGPFCHHVAFVLS